VPDEKQATELITHLETEERDNVSVEAAANLMLAEDALLADINKRFTADKDLVWRLRPFRQGSFEIVVELLAAAAPLLGDAPILLATFKALKEFLSLKCLLAGRKYTITGNNVVIVEGGERVQVSPVGIALFDPKSKGGKAAEKAFDSLGEDKTISGVGFYRAGEHEPFSHVCRDDFESFHVPDSLAETQEKPRRVVVGIRQPSFAKDLVWRLLLDGFKIDARMEDEEFLKRSTTGLESFNQRDRLDVTLNITQERNLVTGLWENKRFVIAKVWKHIPPDEQLGLDDTADESAG